MAYTFEWDNKKDRENLKKNGIPFSVAIEAFYDERRIITRDPAHSIEEKRYFCYGDVRGAVLTVRFTWRGTKIRIIGAAVWRKGKKIYAEKNKVRR